MKLPKQWKHWCRSAHLKPHAGPSYRRGPWLYLRGRGYYWRVNCFGMFQRGDKYEDFDRWALCNIREAPLPKSRAEFLGTVCSLLAGIGATTGEQHG